MKAVGLLKYLPITDAESLMDIELPMPQASKRDLLVKVQAVAVNPVDTKVRKPKDLIEANYKVLGWDAVGVVVAVGEQCELFKVGDAVYYAGDITRQGSNSEYQLIDERIVGLKPKTLTIEQAAALPLTTITAWEALFDRLQISVKPAENVGKSILIIGGAGGVGSIAVQLAAKVAGLTVVATASRPETTEWVKGLGATYVVNHRQDIVPQLQEINLPNVDYILCNNDTDAYFKTMATVIKPQGKICSIVETNAPVDLGLLKNKSATFVWELMYTRSMYQTHDMIAQHEILDKVTALIDNGTLKTTVNQVMRPINAANLRAAHAQLESGTTIGKIVLSSW